MAHFRTRFSSEELVSGGPEESFFDEFGADYTMATINAKSNLAYMLAYGKPYDFANFDTVLHQAGISDRKLPCGRDHRALKSKSQVKQF